MTLFSFFWSHHNGGPHVWPKLPDMGTTVAYAQFLRIRKSRSVPPTLSPRTRKDEPPATH